MKPHVHFDAVGHHYEMENGPPVEALRDLSFTIDPGEFVAVLGPSGCGKSTLLRLLAGLFPATHGGVSVYDAPVTGPRDDMGIVFQKPTLLPWKSVLENVLFPLRHRGKRPSAQQQEEAKALLCTMGLGDFLAAMPDQLSGGMQQRVAIARALLMDPDLLVMDEPFSALDALTREEMGFELLRLWQERQKTVLFITHSIAEAVLLADRVLVFSPRPASLLAELEIALPRPRTADTIHDRAFADATQQLRELIYKPELALVASSQGSVRHGTA